MTSDTAQVQELLKEHSRLAGRRAPVEGEWQEIADRCWPARADIQRTGSPTARRYEQLYDSISQLALSRFAAVLEHVLTPHEETWHELGPSVRTPSFAAARYLEDLRDQLFEVRYRPDAGFSAALFEAYLSLGCFGAGCVYVDDLPGKGIGYRAIPMPELFIGEDARGRVDRVHRAYRLTVDQARGAFGALPSTLAARKEHDELELLHVVRPRQDSDPSRPGAAHLPWASFHILRNPATVLRVSGYRGLPYIVARYMQTSGNPYGVGPARLALADIKVVNKIGKTLLNAANRSVEPPLLAADHNLPPPILTPNAINAGWLGPDGRPLLQPLQAGQRLEIGEEMARQRRDAVSAAFLGDFFKTLVQNPSMTATQVMQLAGERAAQLSPFVGRMQMELLGPLIEREVELLAAAGALPKLPSELEAHGGAYAIKYRSPFTRAQTAQEGAAILRTIEGIAPLAQIDPTVMDVFDPEAVARRLAEVNGVPASVLRSPDAMKALAERRAQQQQAEQLLKAAPVAADAARTLQGANGAGAGLPG